MDSEMILLGWREWVALPRWGIKKIKAKLDTGAKTSALHAENIQFKIKKGSMSVTFQVFPLQKTKNKSHQITAKLIEIRRVRSSDGVVTERPVVKTDLIIGDKTWPIEITLVNRDIMGFRMLIGRSALKKRALIDPSRSYLSRKKHPSRGF